jgi:hypothetical protein
VRQEVIAQQEEVSVRDPHVDAIHYAVGSGEGISYRDPESVSFFNHLGTFDVSDGKLRIVPSEHFPDEDDARQAVEPFLRAWEIESDLTSHIGMIRFKFDRAEVIDRNPPLPGSSQVIELKSASMVVVGGSLSTHLTCSKYPQPPGTFRVTPEVQQAYRRWLGYRLGKEPLQSMAYFVLTQLENATGSRKNAAHSFQFDFQVLDTIGRLSSTKGDESTARKAPPGNRFQELSSSEKQWLEEAMRRVVHRLGEYASGDPLAPISLCDLPQL